MRGGGGSGGITWQNESLSAMMQLGVTNQLRLLAACTARHLESEAALGCQGAAIA